MVPGRNALADAQIPRTFTSTHMFLVHPPLVRTDVNLDNYLCSLAQDFFSVWFLFLCFLFFFNRVVVARDFGVKAQAVEIY